MTREQEKICLMFDRIAHTYDPVNRILSMGQDVRWRSLIAQTVRTIEEKNIIVLDIATGTADVLLTLCAKCPAIAKGYGVDLAEKMLEIGQKKVSALGLEHKISLSKADAANLPFTDHSVDVVTISFGIRNFSSMHKALSEIKRVLKPSGTLYILEFSLPKNNFIKALYLFYFRYILPFVGGLLSKDKKAYRYLNKTVESFPYGEEFCQILSTHGFKNVQQTQLTFGIATLYQGHSC